MGKIKGFVNDFIAHWNKPKEGQYLSNKEFMAFSVGGMGVHGLGRIQGYLTLATGLYLAYIYGVKPMEIAVLGTVLSVLNILKTPFISSLVDNTQTKRGKFIPYLLWLPIPLVVLYTACCFLPWFISGETHSGHIAQIVVFGILFFITSLVQGLYMNAYSNLAQVMTPNQDERTTKLFSLGSFLYNLGPSVLDILFPLLAGLFAVTVGEVYVAGYNTAKGFKLFIPIFSIAFALLSFLVPIYCKERLIVAKDYKAKVPFKDGFKATVRNKYFWLINTSSILAFARGSVTGLVAWTVTFIMKTDKVLGFINALVGTASIPGMLLAPLIIKKIGSRNLLLIVYALGCVFCIPLYFICSQSFFANQSLLAGWIVIIFIYLTNIVNGVQSVTAPAMNSEMLDYEQLHSGLRLDGFMANFGGMYTTFVGMGTGLIVPWFQQKLGLESDYSVLNNPEVSSRIYKFMVIAAFLSGLLAIIPLFWYDMTEAKHKEILEKLKEIAEKHNEELDAEGFSADLAYEGSVELNEQDLEQILEEEQVESEKAEFHSEETDNEN